jgi:hypothetical protein
MELWQDIRRGGKIKEWIGVHVDQCILCVAPWMGVISGGTAVSRVFRNVRFYSK